MQPVLLLTCIFFIHFIARQIAGPLLPAMEVELGISHAQSGMFILFMGIGFFVSQIAFPYLAGPFGYRFCVFLSLGGSAAAAGVLGLLGSARALSVGFLALGVTSGLYVPAGIALITALVRQQDWGKALGIHETAPNLALISVPFLATAAVAVGTWRIGYVFTAVALAVLGMTYAVFGVDAHERPSAPDFRRIREVAAAPSFWHVGILLSLAVGVETGVYAMLPLFLVNERSFDLAAANHLLGVSRIPGLAMVLAAGWITDRIGFRKTIALALAATGAAVIALGAGPRWGIPAAVFMQAGASACLFPPILSAASRVSAPENRALTLSLSLAVAPVIGGGILPSGIALAGDLGSFAAGMIAAGIITASGVILVPFLKPKSR